MIINAQIKVFFMIFVAASAAFKMIMVVSVSCQWLFHVLCSAFLSSALTDTHAVWTSLLFHNLSKTAKLTDFMQDIIFPVNHTTYMYLIMINREIMTHWKMLEYEHIYIYIYYSYWTLPSNSLRYLLNMVIVHCYVGFSGGMPRKLWKDHSDNAITWLSLLVGGFNTSEK